MCWLFPNAVRKDRRKTRAWCEIRPLGCRELRAPTWRNLTSLYAARPPQRAARIGALMNFIPPHVQPFPSLSSVARRSQLQVPLRLREATYNLFCKAMAPPRSAIPEAAIVAEDESIYLVKQRARSGRKQSCAATSARENAVSPSRAASWARSACAFGSIFLLSWFPD